MFIVNFWSWWVVKSNKKAPKSGLFCHLVRLMGFEPNNYHAISCFLWPCVQFRVQFFVTFGTDTPIRSQERRTQGGPSCVGSF